MIKSLPLYQLTDDGAAQPFIIGDRHVILYAFTYEAQRMGGAPSITANLKAPSWVKDELSPRIFLEFNGEKYKLKHSPSSSKSYDNELYVYNLVFVSERSVLDNVYMIDAVQGNSNIDGYQSNSAKITFVGDVEQYAKRIHSALSYVGLDYSVVIDDDVSTESKLVSFEDKFFTEALQEISNVFGIPYYFVGKTIHVGWNETTITKPLKYSDGLMSVNKEIKTQRIVNRATGSGSSDNIPFYYPNPTPRGVIHPETTNPNHTLVLANPYNFSLLPTGAVLRYYYAGNEDYAAGWHIVEASGEVDPYTVELAEYGITANWAWDNGEEISLVVDYKIPYAPTLMPPIYRESKGVNRFYNAYNEFYEDANYESGYVEFPNPYEEGDPKEAIAKFEDIKPSIVGMTNALGQRIDLFSEFAYDLYDNDDEDEEGNFKHPYFFGKLKKFDGDFGFNLFEHTIETDEMVIAMTSGVCGACEFTIMVDESTQRNLVMVDENGNLERDANGNVMFAKDARGQDRQNDTQNNEVWIALRKDIDTYNQVMPNVSMRHYPNINDTFVILHIDLPEAYVLAAENKLKKAIIDYIALNNAEKYNFSVNLSRIFLQKNPNIFSALNENAKITLEYCGEEFEFFVSAYKYTKNGADVLPEVSITLSDALDFSPNAFQQAISAIRQEALDIVNTLDVAAQFNKRFLRKDIADTAKEIITFRKGLITEDGLSTDDFQKGNVAGSGAAIYRDGDSTVVEADKLIIRKEAIFSELVINQTTFKLGETVHTMGGCEITKVEEADGYFRCYYDNKDGKRLSGFVVGDQARCQRYDAIYDTITKYYWRLVIAVADDYVDLSKSDFDGSGSPEVGDEIVQLGHRTNTERQNAIVIASTPQPSILQYRGINSYKMPVPETQIAPDNNTFTGLVNIKSGSTGAKNLADLPGIIEEAMGEIDFDSMEFGKYNLLRNSGFTGDYLSKQLDPSSSISNDSELFSPSLEYWNAINATAQKSDTSESGVEVALAVGSLTQTLASNVIRGENYVISFRAKGTSLTVSIAGVEKTIALTSEYTRYVEKITASRAENVFAITNADCTICEIQFERGTVVSAWGYSMWDNQSELAYYQALRYLSGAIKDGSTTINGGLILSNILALGNYLNGSMDKITAGVSGTYNDDDDVAFWGGGSIEQAILAVAKFRDNPQYQPTEEEWAQMAKFAVTHGGDVFMRGYIHALGGYFRGTVDIADQKILLNADGSGHFANGNVRWDSAGRVQKSAPDSVIWTRVNAYDDNAIIDYTKGSYIVLSYDSYDYEAGEAVDRYTLATPAFSNFSIFLRNDTYDGGNMPAYLTGNFKATKNGTTVEAQGLGITTSSDNANIMVELVYESDGYWHLQSEDFTFASGSSLIEVGAAKSESFFNGYFTNVDDEGNTLNFRVIDGRLKLLS